nr:hypothetical protein [Mucilaginibacter sp. FT3.2]
MNRRKFLAIAEGSIVVAGTTCYALSDGSNLVRADLKQDTPLKSPCPGYFAEIAQ